MTSKKTMTTMRTTTTRQHIITSPIGLSATGSGPKIFAFTIQILIIGVIMKHFFPSLTGIPGYEKTFCVPFGWAFVGSGSMFYVLAIVQFLKGFRKGILVTCGAFSVSRNPIYSSWALFILPGIALLCNNWFFFLAALIMMAAIVKLVKREENELREKFGKQFAEYASRVKMIISFPTIG